MGEVAEGIEIIAATLQEELNRISLKTKYRRPKKCWTRKWIKKRAKFGVSVPQNFVLFIQTNDFNGIIFSPS